MPTTETAPELIDHSLALVFPFFFPSPDRNNQVKTHYKRLNQLTFSGLEISLPVSARQQEKLNKIADEKIWQEKKLALSTELHSVVASTLDDSFFKLNQSKSNQHLHHGYPSLTVTQQALDFLNNELGGKKQGLEVKLSNNAVNRLTQNLAQPETSPWIRFNFEEIRLFMLGTGVGGIVVKIKFPYLKSILYFLECAYAISRNTPNSKESNEVRWFSTDPENSLPSMRGLAEIVTLFAPFLGDAVNPKTNSVFTVKRTFWRKVFSYSAVKTDKGFNNEQQEDFLVQISRNFSLDYKPYNNEKNLSGFYQPFDYLTHQLSIEGGASWINMEQAKSITNKNFINNFVKDSAQKSYYPLAILAYFKYLALVNLSINGVRKINFYQPSDIDLSHLNSFKADVNNFRLNYRFTHISEVSMHNEIFKRWNEVFPIDVVLDDISSDASDIGDFISATQNQKIEQKLKHIEYIVIFFGGIEFLKEMLGFNLFYKIFNNDPTALELLPIGMLAALALYIFYLMGAKK